MYPFKQLVARRKSSNIPQGRQAGPSRRRGRALAATAERRQPWAGCTAHLPAKMSAASGTQQPGDPAWPEFVLPRRACDVASSLCADGRIRRHAWRQMSQLAKLASISLALIVPAAAASPMAMRCMLHALVCLLQAAHGRGHAADARSPASPPLALPIPHCVLSARVTFAWRFLSCSRVLSPLGAARPIAACVSTNSQLPVPQAWCARSGPAFDADAAPWPATPRHRWCAGPWHR